MPDVWLKEEFFFLKDNDNCVETATTVWKILHWGGGWRETILFFTGEILVDADIDDSDGSFECDQPAPH